MRGILAQREETLSKRRRSKRLTAEEREQKRAHQKATKPHPSVKRELKRIQSTVDTIKKLEDQLTALRALRKFKQEHVDALRAELAKQETELRGVEERTAQQERTAVAQIAEQKAFLATYIQQQTTVV